MLQSGLGSLLFIFLSHKGCGSLNQVFDRLQKNNLRRQGESFTRFAEGPVKGI